MAQAQADRDDSRTLRWISGGDLAKIRKKLVMVIGCGGTGSLFTLFAGQLGVEQLVVVDDDIVEASNLSRFVNASTQDVGRRKVDVVCADLTNRLPRCAIQVIPDRFPSSCRRFGLTYIDIGTGFNHDDSDYVLSSGGQVLISRVGAACIMCMGFQHVADTRGYAAPGVDIPAGSVLTLNAVVVAMGLEILAAEARGTSLAFNVLRFDRGSLVSGTELVAPDPDCRVCGAKAGPISDILPGW